MNITENKLSRSLLLFSFWVFLISHCHCESIQMLTKLWQPETRSFSSSPETQNLVPDNYFLHA